MSPISLLTLPPDALRQDHPEHHASSCGERGERRWVAASVGAVVGVACVLFAVWAF